MTNPFQWFVDGERRAKAGPQTVDVGVVTSLSPPLVNCSGMDERVVVTVGLTLAIGDAVLLNRVRGVAYVTAKVGTGIAPAAPVAAALSGSGTFPAVFTWSWRDGQDFAGQQDVRQGAQDGAGQWTGAWFYQGGPGASLAGVTVTSCSVNVARGSGGVAGAQAAHLYLSSSGIWPTTDQAAPTTASTVTDVTVLPGESKWAAIPAAWGQAIVDTDAGLMVSGATPQVFLAGRDSDPESGLLRIDWERT